MLQNEFVTNLPQQVGKTKTFPSSVTLWASVVELNETENGSESQVWLSGIQNRASCTNLHPSTKHLFHPSWHIIRLLITSWNNLLLHVPQPTCATITTPDPDIPVSLSEDLGDKESSFQFGQPITPSTIFPSTTRAKPTWNQGQMSI